MRYTRISPSFANDDVKEKYVADMLLTVDRKKSKLITEAVLFYLANVPSEKIPCSKQNRDDLALILDQATIFLGNDWKNNYIIPDNKNHNSMSDNDKEETFAKNVSTPIDPPQDNTVNQFIDALDFFV